MDTDTYRYLMSALMQVFGALIALDAVFVVFLHQRVIDRQSKLLFQIGKYESMIRRNKNSLDECGPIEAAINADALLLETRSASEIHSLINDTRDLFQKRKVAHEKDFTRWLDKFEKDSRASNFHQKEEKKNFLEGIIHSNSLFTNYVDQYHGTLKVQLFVPKLIVATMGIPAFLVVAFSTALAQAGIMSENLNACYGYSAILFSFTTLYYLVATARKSITLSCQTCAR